MYSGLHKGISMLKNMAWNECNVERRKLHIYDLVMIYTCMRSQSVLLVWNLKWNICKIIPLMHFTMYWNEGEWRLVAPSFEKTWVTLSIPSLIMGGNMIFIAFIWRRLIIANVCPSLKIAIIEH